MSVLVGREAPDFVAPAVQKDTMVEQFKLSSYKGKHIILFFYPLDFTFVCPTELHAFSERMADFAARDTQVVGASVDSHYSHFAWLHTSRDQGGIEGVEYPIVSDITKQISRDYGVLLEDESVAYRGLFLIDRSFVVRHQVVNDLPLGRSVDEALRMVDALQYFEEHGEVCPADWKKGEKAMKPDQSGLKEYFQS